LNNVSSNNKKFLEKIFGNVKATEEEVKHVYNLFKKVGSIEYAKNTAIQNCEKAKKALELIPNSETKKILLDLAEYSIKREK
jgi:geranylgeranyl diphosphate synthase type I